MNLAATIIAASALATATPESTGDRSLTDSGGRTLLAQLPFIPVPHLEKPPDTKAREQVLLLRSSVKALTEALALANGEAEVFKRQAEEMSLRLEALGVPGLEGGESKLEGRLIAAVRDLRLTQDRLDATKAQLVRLSEVVQLVVASNAEMDAELRAGVEAEIRKTNEVLGAAIVAEPLAVEAGLTDAMVIDLKQEISLVVANVGSKNGVRLGMPFQVWRGSSRIGEVRAVDVRESICGAIIQSLENEKNPIKTGDRLRVDAKK